MPFFAHSHPDLPREQWQPLRDHLLTCARNAKDFAASFGAGDCAFLCGLLHDLGKYSLAFQKRLEGGKRVDHSLAGAVEAQKFLLSGGLRVLANPLAAIISGHHTGLADGVAQGTEAQSLLDRLRGKDTLPGYTAWQKEISLPQAMPFMPAFPRLTEEEKANQEEVLAFRLFFWVRMLYSCLVDADFLDTEAFIRPEKAARRGGYPALEALHDTFDRFMSEIEAKAKPGEVNTQRAIVLAACRREALASQGVFSLTVPTGGGKTLSSLAFALDHAQKHGLRRIIYVIPYTSIIEQTAEVFREALGPCLAHAVLEHHSNAAEDKPEKLPEAADDHEDARTLAFENWDAPIIVTTAVQFFESLFASRSSRCRKLHRIAESVIVLDEAQTIPTSLFRPCCAAIKELTGMYRASAVLCTATQPEVGITPWNRNGLTDVQEIIPDVPGLFRALDRVRVDNIGTLEPPALAARLAAHHRVLCIVNTRAEARELCERLRDNPQDREATDGAHPHGEWNDDSPQGAGDAVFHLSTWMCPAHRKDVLQHVKELLKNPDNPLVRLVATSLIEAGVDIDFPVVYRAMTGVDSIAQAAGRCNREGRLELGQKGQTFVFSFPGTLRGEMDRRKNAAEAVQRKNLPLLSPEAVSFYFRELHSLAGPDGLDKPQILRRIRESLVGDSNGPLFPFRSVDRNFRFIDDHTVPLIIPYDDEAREALDTLREGKADRHLYRLLQQWTVGVPERAINGLTACGAAKTVGFAGQHYELVNEDLYRGLKKRQSTGPAWGLDLRNPVFREVEGLTF